MKHRQRNTHISRKEKKGGNEEEIAYTNDMRSTSLCREHAQNPSPTTDVQHSLVLEQVWVVHDSRPVRARPNRVLEHLLMYP